MLTADAQPWQMEVPQRETGDNPLLEQRLIDARDAALWLGSPHFAWFKAQLEGAQRRLIGTVARPGMEPDERLLMLGKLSLINDLLDKPAQLAELLKRHSEPAPAVVSGTPRLSGGLGSPGLV